MIPTYNIEKIEQGGVTQPYSDDNFTVPIAIILHDRAVVIKALILLP